MAQQDILMWKIGLILCFVKAFTIETQIWTRETVEINVNETLDIRLQTAFRWRETSHLYKKFAQIAFDFHLPHEFTMTPIYRQTIQRKRTGPWRNSAHPMLDITKVFVTYCSWRTRFQYKSRSNDFFFRNKFEVFYPLEWGSFQLSPFLSEEFFVLYFKRFSENRFGGGFRFLFGPHVQISVYDLYRILQASSHWQQSNVYNFEVAIAF